MSSGTETFFQAVKTEMQPYDSCRSALAFDGLCSLVDVIAVLIYSSLSRKLKQHSRNKQRSSITDVFMFTLLADFLIISSVPLNYIPCVMKPERGFICKRCFAVLTARHL